MSGVVAQLGNRPPPLGGPRARGNLPSVGRGPRTPLAALFLTFANGQLGDPTPSRLRHCHRARSTGFPASGGEVGSRRHTADDGPNVQAQLGLFPVAGPLEVLFQSGSNFLTNTKVLGTCKKVSPARLNPCGLVADRDTGF
jgi:hypothetical protein